MSIGLFDPVYLSDFVEMILRDSPSEIELLCMPIPNQRGAPMLVARYDGEYIALAGLEDKMKKCD
jgi:hypothetical protein